MIEVFISEIENNVYVSVYGERINKINTISFSCGVSYRKVLLYIT